MKTRIWIALAFLIAIACNSSSSRTDGAPTRATSAVSGLEEVTILARGME